MGNLCEVNLNSFRKTRLSKCLKPSNRYTLSWNFALEAISTATFPTQKRMLRALLPKFALPSRTCTERTLFTEIVSILPTPKCYFELSSHASFRCVAYQCRLFAVKFENIMFETAARDSEIKIIDFGLSKKFLPGDQNKTMTEGVGTIYTMAPQVIRGTFYTSKADLWSLGVIAFMLLASQKPFKGKKRRQVVEHIMQCDYSFDSEIWSTLSAESKDFISHLLVMDPDERMDAKTALKHRWLSKEYKLSDRRPDEALMRKVEDSLLAYKYTSALKKVALNVIARKSTPREIFQLRKAFGQYDIENDGTISFEEFKEALKQSNYSDKELEEIFSSIEVNAIGHIMYTGKSSCINDSSIIQRSIQLPHTFTTEFLAATLEVKGCVEEERIADAFDRLDNDESGYISPQDLRELLVGYSEKEIQALIAEADTDHDGQISFEEFKKIFNKRTETFAAKALSLDQELPAAEAPAAD